MNKIIELLGTLAIYIIIALVSFAVKKVYPLVKEYATTKINEIKINDLREFLVNAIETAETEFKDIVKSGVAKKNHVTSVAYEYMAKHNITFITENQLEILVEGIFTELDADGLVNQEKQETY